MDRGDLCQGVHGGLNIGQGVSQDEVFIGRKGSGAECRYENSLGGEVRIGHYSVGTLNERTPEAGLEQEVLDFLCRCGSLGAKVHGFLLCIGLYHHCQQFSLVAADDGLHLAAYRAGEENLRALFVSHKG